MMNLGIFDLLEEIPLEDLKASLIQMKEIVSKTPEIADEEESQLFNKVSILITKLHDLTKGINDYNELDLTKQVELLAFTSLFIELMEPALEDSLDDEEYDDDDDIDDDEQEISLEDLLANRKNRLS